MTGTTVSLRELATPLVVVAIWALLQLSSREIVLTAPSVVAPGSEEPDIALRSVVLGTPPPAYDIVKELQAIGRRAQPRMTTHPVVGIPAAGACDRLSRNQLANLRALGK